jgi:hypothetical protein
MDVLLKFIMGITVGFLLMLVIYLESVNRKVDRAYKVLADFMKEIYEEQNEKGEEDESVE